MNYNNPVSKGTEIKLPKFHNLISENKDTEIGLQAKTLEELKTGNK